MNLRENRYSIDGYCSIKHGSVILNGEKLYSEIFDTYSEFIKSVYKEFDTNYPKFFKMDNLSKLAFMAAELLLKRDEKDSDMERNIALVFSNRGGSIDTDRKHQESLDNTQLFASPAVFVYTLPNICLGEISIRHRLFSENSFFIFNHFNASHLYYYAECLLTAEKAEKVLCGWVDFDGEKYEAFMYLVSKTGKWVHSKDEIKRLYNA